MKVVMAREVERFLFRPGLQERARYYGVIFLNQMPLSHNASEGNTSPLLQEVPGAPLLFAHDKQYLVVIMLPCSLWAVYLVIESSVDSASSRLPNSPCCRPCRGLIPDLCNAEIRLDSFLLLFVLYLVNTSPAIM